MTRVTVTIDRRAQRVPDLRHHGLVYQLEQSIGRWARTEDEKMLVSADLFEEE